MALFIGMCLRKSDEKVSLEPSLKAGAAKGNADAMSTVIS